MHISAFLKREFIYYNECNCKIHPIFPAWTSSCSNNYHLPGTQPVAFCLPSYPGFTHSAYFKRPLPSCYNLCPWIHVTPHVTFRYMCNIQSPSSLPCSPYAPDLYLSGEIPLNCEQMYCYLSWTVIYLRIAATQYSIVCPLMHITYIRKLFL